MGASIGSAIGLQVARPSQRVAVLCGDGGFAMACGDVSTAARERCPIVFVVFNDQRLGMVELGHQLLYGRTPTYGTGPIDFAALGRSMGARAILVDRPGVILDSPILRGPADGPVVIDIRIDETMRVPRVDRFVPLGAPKIAA